MGSKAPTPEPAGIPQNPTSTPSREWLLLCRRCGKSKLDCACGMAVNPWGCDQVAPPEPAERLAGEFTFRELTQTLGPSVRIVAINPTDPEVDLILYTFQRAMICQEHEIVRRNRRVFGLFRWRWYRDRLLAWAEARSGKLVWWAGMLGVDVAFLLVAWWIGGQGGALGVAVGLMINYATSRPPKWAR